MASSTQTLSQSPPEFDLYDFDTNGCIEDGTFLLQGLNGILPWHIIVALMHTSTTLYMDGYVRFEPNRKLTGRSAGCQDILILYYKHMRIRPWGVWESILDIWSDCTLTRGLLPYHDRLELFAYIKTFARIDSTFDKFLSPVICVPVVRSKLVGRWIVKWSQALGIASRRRSVYLMATRLAHFASISDETGAATNIFSGLWIPILQSSLRIDLINHWALLIIGDDGLEDAPLLCQLRVSPGWNIEYDVMENYTLAQNIIDNGRHIGFTMCSNRAIKEQGGHEHSHCPLPTISRLIGFILARQVLNSMPNIYNVANNNCQTFCDRLFECIRQTTTTAELLGGREKLPREASPTVANRRIVELVSSMITPEPQWNDAMAARVNPPPLLLSTAVLVIIDVLSVTVLCLSYWQLSTWLYCLVFVVLASQGLYSNSGLLRRRVRWGHQDEGLKDVFDEEAKWAFDYLVPFIISTGRQSRDNQETVKAEIGLAGQLGGHY